MVAAVGYRWRLLSLALVLHVYRHSCVSASSYRLLPNGRNVCSTTRRVQEFHFLPERLSAGSSPDEPVDEPVNEYGSNEHIDVGGKRSPTRMSPLIIGKQSARLVNQTVYHCCAGWRYSGQYARECPVAVCSQACQHGNCTAPDVCSCQAGYMGTRCEVPCPQGRYGPHCEQICNCGYRQCDVATGRCTPSCPLGSMGPNCVMPCPPGRFGPDCVDFCTCPLTGHGEVLCDPLTGNCTEPTPTPTAPGVHDSTMLEGTDTFHEFFQYDTESPSIVNSNRKHPLRVRAMRLGISGAAGVLLMIVSFVLTLYVYRKFRNRPCVCLQRKKLRAAAVLRQQADRITGMVDRSNHVVPTPRAHFPNPHLPHAMPYRLPSLCNYTGLRHTGNRPGSELFDALPGAPSYPESSINATSADTPHEDSTHRMPEETIYEVRPSLVAKSRKDQDMTSGYIENDTFNSMSRVVQGCEVDLDSATSSVAYHRDDDEGEYEEEYDYPYADNAKIKLGFDRFQTKRSRPGAHEHDNSIYAVVLENEKGLHIPHSIGEYERENHHSRGSDFLADAGNHGRNHTDPLPLPSRHRTKPPPTDGTYTALIAGNRSPTMEASFPERTPGSGCSTAPAPMVLTRVPSVTHSVTSSEKPRASPVSRPVGKATSIRPRGMSDAPLRSYDTSQQNSFASSRPRNIVSQVDSNGYTTAIRTFSSMRQPRRPATKRKSRPSIELRQTPRPMIPPRLSESDIPPLSPDPTTDFSMKTQLLEAKPSDPRYVNGCIISPKQKPKERIRSRTPGMLRRAKNVLPLPSAKDDDGNEKLYDDIFPLGDEDRNV